MKRRSRFLMAVSILGLFPFLCGCGKSNDQASGIHRNEAKPPGKVKSSDTNGPGAVAVPGETNRVGGVTEGQSGGEEPFTLSGSAKPVDTTEGFEINPHGRSTLPDGTIYEGETFGDVPRGWGTVTDPRGTHLEGEYRDGKMYRVSGTWVQSDGTKEEGTWNRDGSKSGGTITWPDGRVYKGDWKVVEGAPEAPHGSGTMTWPDGRKYVGEFQDGQMNGRGLMNYPERKVEDGFWTHGKFVGAAK
jgi:hypothetical protein